MSGHLLIQCLLLFFLLNSDFTHGKVHYIRPTLDSPCPQDSSSCYTLSQFIANNETNISLFFLPGNHTLSKELLLTHGYNFSLTKYAQNDVRVLVQCFGQLGRFDISDATSVSIKDIHFIGCGSNRVSQVTCLTITDSVFKNVEDTSTVLVLNVVDTVTIFKSFFLYNTLENQYTLTSLYSILDQVYHQRNTPSGVLYTAFSNVSVNSCSFSHNTGDIGGALVAHNSTLHIDSCTFSYNIAIFGGAMVTSGSTIDIDVCTFTKNSAHGGGGVMITNTDSFTISNTTFSENSAGIYAGVMITFNNTSFIIINSTFVSNSVETVTVAGSGGVITAYDSSFIISNSTFTFNVAYYGGVITTYGDSSFFISTSTFTSNFASYSGVLHILGESSFTINSSAFNSNRAYNGGVMTTLADSIFIISTSAFISNSAAENGGVIETIVDSSFTIKSCVFTSNRAMYGGVIHKFANSSFNIYNSSFKYNFAHYYGGVVEASFNSSFTISDSAFTSNSAYDGGVITTFGDSSFNISSCTFTSNIATGYGGVIDIFSHASGAENITFSVSPLSSVTIVNSTFISNEAHRGGVVSSAGNSLFIISDSIFTLNHATHYHGQGGVFRLNDRNSITIINSTFTSNTAYYGGVMQAPHDSSFTIINCIFSSNHAGDSGGVLRTFGDPRLIISNSTFSDSSFIVINSSFSSNDGYYGGVFYTNSSLTINNSTFINNTAFNRGGIIRNLGGALSINNCHFSANSVVGGGRGLIFQTQSSTHIVNTVFSNNLGSIYIFNSNLTLFGDSTFKKCVEPFNNNSWNEGGVITSFQSTVIFGSGSTTQFINNQARDGGAILAIESTITMYGKTVIASNNMTLIANSSGGGISLKQSRLDIKERSVIVGNSADRGGGIHSTSSTIAVFQPGTLHVINNNARLGGGMYLEVNSKLYVLMIEEYRYEYFLVFIGNHANYGGAAFVADSTNSEACSSDTECFIQTLALYQGYEALLDIVTMYFSENTVTSTKQGSNFFGGLLDRCTPSPFAEVYLKGRAHYSGITYLQEISSYRHSLLSSISSQPVSVCFCNKENQPDCSYQLPPVTIKKGEAFNVSIVAVDQVNNTVLANISALLSSTDGGFGEGQQSQGVEKDCTQLIFNVFSPHNYETINLFADGPCGSASLSTIFVTIQFTECTCDIGFEPRSNSKSSTRCECICDSQLSSYITGCDYATSSVFRSGTNAWITYINETDPPGYVTYPNCPFDYCRSLTENVSINFNLPSGADAQCAYNRTRTLCGLCKQNLSLSLASSRCLPCHSYWPGVCAVILLVAVITGVMLVAALLALNVTVSVGLINGFIFYGNIMSAGSAVFFPSSEPSFPSVFVAWLNLDIGIDVCFVDGLDAYIKTWLQLAFPVYIISLVIIVIIVSECSDRFAALIGKRDPISTLATLVLLSYAKLLSVTITALSFAVLDYPEGRQEIVWLPDGNVKYFRGKHIPLALIALLIILVGLPYTILLFLWQWIVRAPRWKVFRWTRNTKLNAYISSHHIPHNSKYRCWTGLLLVVRVILYITASVTLSANPQTFPLITAILIGGLIVFKGMFGLRVYKNSFVDIVDTALYSNILMLVAFSQYDFKLNVTKQRAVAYTSTVVTLILLIGSICYHVSLLIKRKTPPEDSDKLIFNPVDCTKVDTNIPALTTYSVIEVPKCNHEQDTNSPAIENRNEQENSEEYATSTL